MIVLEHVSVSSMDAFLECPPKWSQERDRDRRYRTAGDAAEAGNLIHGALELWQAPGNDYPREYDGLYQAFIDHLKTYQTTPAPALYDESLEKLKKAYQMVSNHPVIPWEACTYGTEIELKFQLEGWALPTLGFIDRILTVTPDIACPMEIDLYIEDYKTGRAKSRDEIKGGLQPSVYLLWVRTVLIPFLESYGYTVHKVKFIWSFVCSDIVIALDETEIDLRAKSDYIADISHRMVRFADEYNAIADKGSAEINKFLARHEKLTSLCSYCPRTGVCDQLRRASEQNEVIDLTNPEFAIDDLLAERIRFAAAQNAAEARKDKIDQFLLGYMVERNEDAIISGKTGMKFALSQKKSVNFKVSSIVDALGKDFVVTYASIAKEKVENELAVLAISDPDKAKEIRQYLDDTAYRNVSKPFIKATKISEKKPKKAKGETNAATA